MNIKRNKKGKKEFIKELNLLDTSFLVIGAVLGSGIFVTTGYIAGYIPHPSLILLVWVVGGLITLSGALSFAELGSMYPKAGGQYVYIREAYGKMAGFLYGWGFFWFIMCGGIAALAVVFAEYLGYFIPELSVTNYLIRIEIIGINYSLSSGQCIALASIIILSLINYFGIKSGILVQNIFTVLRIASVVLIILLGFAIGKKAGAVNLKEITSFEGNIEWSILKFFGLALIAVLWTFDGWYSVNCTAEEIKRPERNIPLGLIIGTLAVSTIYFLTNLVYIMAVPVEKMKGVGRIAELASNQLFGSGVSSVITAVIMISIFGCLSATILYGPRVYYAVA